MAKKVLVLQPFGVKQDHLGTTVDFDAVYHAIKEAVMGAHRSAVVQRFDEVASRGLISANVQRIIEESDVVVSDLTTTNPNVMFELGYAQALKKPVLIISQSVESLPFDLLHNRVLVYDLREGANDFTRRVRSEVMSAIESPEDYVRLSTLPDEGESVFISYSHQDRQYLERLMTHLKPLEVDGMIDAWVDTKLRAGDKWEDVIEQAIDRAKVVILLVTADFLASDFVVASELPSILENSRARGVRIIPIILKPCRYNRHPELRTFHAINDPSRPVIALTEGERESVYDDVAAAVEQSLGL